MICGKLALNDSCSSGCSDGQDFRFFLQCHCASPDIFWHRISTKLSHHYCYVSILSLTWLRFGLYSTTLLCKHSKTLELQGLTKAVGIFYRLTPLFLSPAEYNSLNSLVSEAFIRFFLETIGHYSLFITQNERGERIFQREAFRKSVASKSIRRFLGVFMESQMFAGFIQDREHRKTRAKGRLLFSECQLGLWMLFLP